MIDRLRVSFRDALLRFLGIDKILNDQVQMKDLVTEHDKALAVTAIVQIKIMNELLQHREALAKKVVKRKDDDDLVN